MNLYLIGYRGSGKSTVAPIVAALLNRECVDSDDWIEGKAQVSIAEIFQKSGESVFRKMETEVITKIAQDENLIVSLGGGVPTFEVNRELITKSGKTVYLSAPIDVLWKRISGDDSSDQRRPDLTDQGGRAEVETLLSVRGPVYEACADYTIDVDELSPQEIADRIVKWFQPSIERK